MITPFGRYCWNRLPFGLKVSSEIFQKRLTAALSGLHVVFAIADDLSIAGSGDTLADAERDHAHNLQQLKERCKAKHIQLNAKKAVEKNTHLSFMGHIITAGGVNWAQIEKEALAVLFGLERFHQYTYGRPVEVVNDHKPIQAILQKPLSQAPKRIQALLMRLNRYDINFVYAPGNTLLLADTLSRAYLPCDPSNKVASSTMQVNALQALPDENLIKVRNAMSSDVEAQALLQVIKNGWPNDRCQLSPAVQPYFPIRDTLSHQDDIILKGERIWIPKALRPDMKRQLHSALGLCWPA